MSDINRSGIYTISYVGNLDINTIHALINWTLERARIDLKKYSWDIEDRMTDSNGSTWLKVRVYEQ